MSERTRWDVQIWFASLVTAAFAAFGAFLAVKQVSRYIRFAGVNWSREQLLAEALWAESWPHMAARIVTPIVVIVAALPGALYLRDRSLSLGHARWALVGMVWWLGQPVSLVLFIKMPTLDTSCACIALRDLHTEAMLSLQDVPAATAALAYLWLLRFRVRKLLATDPDEME